MKMSILQALGDNNNFTLLTLEGHITRMVVEEHCYRRLRVLDESKAVFHLVFF